MRPASCTLFSAVSLALAACSVPQMITPYRMDIQQGNYISQEMVSQLKPGMTREQVRYVLGTPLVADIFHADRWDYVFYRDVRGAGRVERKIAVIFPDGKLARVVGDVVPAVSGEGPATAAATAVQRAGPAYSTPTPEAAVPEKKP